MAAPSPHLLYFYGTECTHCEELHPHMERLEQEEGIVLTKLETWHDDKNAKKLEELDQGRCGGVPFLYNTETDKFICGTCEYDELFAWAKGN